MQALVLSLMTAAVWGLAPLIERRALVGAGIDRTVGHMAFFVAVRSLFILPFMLALAFAARGPIAPLLTREAMRSWLPYIVVGGLVAGGIGQGLYYLALRAGSAGYVVAVGATFPLFTLAFSVIAGWEKVNAWQAFGTALIVTGVAIVALSQK